MTIDTQPFLYSLLLDPPHQAQCYAAAANAELLMLTNQTCRTRNKCHAVKHHMSCRTEQVQNLTCGVSAVKQKTQVARSCFQDA